MQQRAAKSAQVKTSIRVKEKFDPIEQASVVDVRITRQVEVGTDGRCLVFFVAGRQVRLGPLTAEQAENQGDELLDLAVT